jgi:putative transposase
MCDVLDVSRSGFFDWSKRDHEAKNAAKMALVKLVEDIHLGSRQTYGSPRILRVLQGIGIDCGHGKLERLMQDYGIRAKTKRKFKVTTDSKHSMPVAENLANRDFAVGTPNKLWLADITYIWTREGWLYLAAVLDAGTRKLIGWSMKDRMTTDLVQDALNMAYNRQGQPTGVMHHSDRGSQYASELYQRCLASYGMTPSMSGKGQCWDNAPMESFFHSLKTEHVYFEDFTYRSAARESIFEWIEVFYNRQRLHSTLGYSTPECYEQAALAKVS